MIVKRPDVAREEDILQPHVEGIMRRKSEGLPARRADRCCWLDWHALTQEESLPLGFAGQLRRVELSH